MFDLFPQQNFADWLKSTGYRGTSPQQREHTIASIKRLESARIWRPVVFAQAIDQVQPGAIWADDQGQMHITGSAETLERIVDTYLELTGQAVREVI